MNLRRLAAAAVILGAIVPVAVSAASATFTPVCITVQSGWGWNRVANEFAPAITGVARDAFVRRIWAYEDNSSNLTAGELVCIDPSDPALTSSTTTTTVATTAPASSSSTSSTSLPPTSSTSILTTTTSSSTSTTTPSTTSTTVPPPPTGFPTRSTAGTPPGWTPVQTVNGYTASTAGATIQDIRINGNLIITANNVTVRRVQVVDGYILNFVNGVCHNGLLLDQVSVLGGPADGRPAIGQGGYTANRVLIDVEEEGFRVGDSQSCGPVQITNSWAFISAPANCSGWHGDTLQGYLGSDLLVRNTYLALTNRPDCLGTAPFFFPDQGNGRIDIDGLIVAGGGYSFRLGKPGTVRNLHVVNNSWQFGPILVTCSIVTQWSADIVTLNAQGQPVVVRTQPCNTSSG